MGPEKIRLFRNINIPTLFPNLKNNVELRELWTKFYELIQFLNEPGCEPVEFDRHAKSWVIKFTSQYQSKDVMPYVHAFAMHAYKVTVQCYI